ncbi:hypothetical protein A2U01_0058644, partial [Trifolium medium]|nr:hypothetical protein [Trifolium medium]
MQTMMGEEDFEIPSFTVASHDPTTWNQGGNEFNVGGKIPFLSGGINIHGGGNAFINQSGFGGTPFNLTNIQGSRNEFNVGGGGRTSAGRASGESASGGRISGGRALSGGRTSGRGRGGNA